MPLCGAKQRSRKPEVADAIRVCRGPDAMQCSAMRCMCKSSLECGIVCLSMLTEKPQRKCVESRPVIAVKGGRGERRRTFWQPLIYSRVHSLPRNCLTTDLRFYGVLLKSNNGSNSSGSNNNTDIPYTLS